MNLRSEVVIEVEKGDNMYRFCMPGGANYGEAYDAAFEALGKIMELAKGAQESMKRQEKEKDKKD